MITPPTLERRADAKKTRTIPIVNLNPACITSSIKLTSELLVDVPLAAKHCHTGHGIFLSERRYWRA